MPFTCPQNYGLFLGVFQRTLTLILLQVIRSLGTTPISGKTLSEWKGHSRSSSRNWKFHSRNTKLGAKKSTQTFFVQSFLSTLRVMGRPRRKSWTSAAKSAFSCGPAGGEKLFDPAASGRKGQECPREIRTKKFMFMLFFLSWEIPFSEWPLTTWSIRNPQFSEQLSERFPELQRTHPKDFHLPLHSRSVFSRIGWSPRTTAKASRYEWEPYRDTNWWRIYYFSWGRKRWKAIGEKLTVDFWCRFFTVYAQFFTVYARVFHGL